MGNTAQLDTKHTKALGVGRSAQNKMRSLVKAGENWVILQTAIGKDAWNRRGKEQTWGA